ncbi:MAG: ABC-ATPase domain-containing protein [Trichodesmium sp. St16_bin4-tuft]|nr:ABC-ATPase domain-containing protein [Trichodesmium sp. MAG_R01]MDE5073465.1 ABC-ATPase domain-containing protein [Trichodesmium sp. St5_bin8]MDE5077516.1 ABC-ATPase domain-containing protein [Trichodesmium sp. St2_bin6]MDE5092271.1 ABC-ATPase domain-containing protein [Trichodesmium sp. St18_bin3_1_1]MDE5100477.1 ABC-ATPase domain-containing protein [Trichodesmium sp. St16_bin4-tuft]
MTNQQTLRKKLLDLDNANYKAYRDIQGSYQFPDFTLIIDYVQGDPFAAPSKLRVQLPYTVSGFPPELYKTPIREMALRDFLTRKFDRMAYEVSGRRGTGKSGMIAITKMGQEVLERTSVYLIKLAPPVPKPAPGSNPALERAKPIKLSSQKGVEVRLVVGLPAGGRRILGRQAAEMLCDDIPYIVHRILKYEQLDADVCRRHVETVEDTDWLRKQLPEKNLVAFVANGAILPRRSGVDDRPLSSEEVVPFKSPPSLEVEFECPNQGKISGMGIPKGVTLIVGGGYHGKSTLLKAIERGVYNHVPGDGREFVVTDPAAIKIRAEDGRSVAGVDISPFINQLPQNRSTTQFTTENASGSTSQAANIMEALEAGLGNSNLEETTTTATTPVLLVDEDTAATNFMIRDRRMQELIAKEREPITPFIDKVRQLYTDYQVSTILVMGGSGDYFEIADKIIAMENFQAQEVTEKAKEIAEKYATGRTAEGGEKFGVIRSRIPLPGSLDPSRGRRDVRLKVRDVDEVVFGSEDVDLSAVEQLVSKDQLRAIGAAMVYAKKQYMDSNRTLLEIIDAVMADIESKSLDVLVPFPQGDLALFRRFELVAAINRLRTLVVK